MPEAGDNLIVESVVLDRDGSVAKVVRWLSAFFPCGLIGVGVKKKISGGESGDKKAVAVQWRALSNSNSFIIPTTSRFSRIRRRVR